MRFRILSVLLMELLLPGVYSGDVLVEPRGNKPQCKGPKGKLEEANFYNCGQAVCKKTGNSATWNICPQNAKETTVEEIQKTVKGTEMIVKETEKTMNDIKKKVNETEMTVKETDITVEETKNTVDEIEQKVKETEMKVKETETTVKKTEKTVVEIETKVNEIEIILKEMQKILNLLLDLPKANGNLPVVFYKLQEFDIEKNNLVTTLAFLGEEYIVSFDLLLTTLSSSIFNILHLTLGGDIGVYGDRTPAVWLYQKGFYIASAISGNKDVVKQIFPPLQAGKWIHLEISQILIDNKYIFEVKVDEVSYWVIENNKATVFKNIKVFASNPWHSPAGKIKYLKVQTKRL